MKHAELESERGGVLRPLVAIAVGVALLAAMSFGVSLRWVLAGSLTLPLEFGDMRHAHSHMGYYGVLFPLAWLGWGAAGVRTPGRWMSLAYAASTLVACVGFAHSGYGPVAIAASTAIAVLWAWSAWPLLGRMRVLRDPLGGVPLGLVLSLACIPPIALTLRSDPVLAAGFVSTFLSGLLFLVIVPSALAAARLTLAPWPLMALTGTLSCVAMGVAPNLATRAGLLAFAVLLLGIGRAPRLALHARLAWVAVALGMGAMALGVVPNVRPVALGAIHFLVLGPIMATLAPLWLEHEPPSWAWWAGHATWGAMSVALVAQAFGAGAWTWVVAAVGGSGTLAWWVLALANEALRRRRRGSRPR